MTRMSISRCSTLPAHRGSSIAEKCSTSFSTDIATLPSLTKREPKHQSDRQNPASPFQRRPCGCGLDRACPFNPRSTIGMKDADLLFPSKSMKCGKSHLALPVFRGGGGLIIRLGRQPGRQAGLCRAASVVNELKEAQVDGQLLLRETAVRTEPGAQQRPEALDGINVGFAETVAILVTRILAPPMADRPGRSPRSSGGHRWRTRRCG
jgi:hypothetical protein